MKAVFAASIAALLAASAASAAPTAGSIAFTMFNSDANDDFSFVALEDINAGTTIYFRDDEWSGAAFNDANEATLSWTAPAGGVVAGSVILFTEISVARRGVSSGTLGTPGSANFGINNGDEVLYAYISTGDAFTGTFTFLTAITNGAAFAAANGQLTGTGLADGTTAFRLAPASADVGAYTSLRNNQTSFGAYLPQVYNLANWNINAGGAGDQSVAFRPFDTTPFTIPSPGALALLAIGSVIGSSRRRGAL